MRTFFQLTFWIWYPLGAVVMATGLVKISPYISPDRPWSDWAVLLALAAGLIGAVAWGTRRTSGQKLREYKGLCDRIAHQQGMLERARQEQWPERAIDRVAGELAGLKQQKSALEKAR